MRSFYYAETTVSITAHYTDEKRFSRQSIGIVKKPKEIGLGMSCER
jgi:hypothetical protein